MNVLVATSNMGVDFFNVLFAASALTQLEPVVAFTAAVGGRGVESARSEWRLAENVQQKACCSTVAILRV